jgi:S-formylglutathione hydrolase FrmB
MDPMAAAARTSTWLDGLGDWSWPGAAAPAVDLAPAAWVPALPAAPSAPPAASLPVPLPAPARRAPLPRPLRLARLVLLLAVGGATFAISSGVLRARPGHAPVAGRPIRIAPRLDRPIALPPAATRPLRGFGRPSALAPVNRPAAAATAPSVAATAPNAPLPKPVLLRSDAAGSTIATISYASHALGWDDTYLAYLPPGYATQTTRRYPVLYLLHGDGEPASSFLRLGLQQTLDRLIDSHAIPPLIAVMLQANGLPNNWRNTAGPKYDSYVGEVQQLTDRVLRTIPNRASRGIAGYSMGGFGAMNVALSQLGNYSVVESWEGFFDNLSARLAADRSLLRRMPLHAFVWGGLQDDVANPREDDPWAASLRAAGAEAESALYPGGHDFATIEAHLASMLTFAGRALRS